MFSFEQANNNTNNLINFSFNCHDQECHNHENRPSTTNTCIRREMYKKEEEEERKQKER